MDARFWHLALNDLVGAGYAALLFTVIRQRLWERLPWFTAYLAVEVVKHLIRDPYHHSALYNWYQPFVIGLRALAILEAAALAGKGLPRWERLVCLVAPLGAAICLFAITLSLPAESEALRAFERHRQQVETGIAAFALLATVRLPRTPHLTLMTLYSCAYSVTGFVNYRHATTLALRWRLYYVQSFGFLVTVSACLAAWLWLTDCCRPHREARLGRLLGGG